MREKNLPNALDPVREEQEGKPEQEPTEREGRSSTPTPEEDLQLQRAVELLKGWTVFKKILPMAQAAQAGTK